MTGGQYTNILLERRGAVGVVTLNRPQALNALNAALVAEIGSAFDDLEADPAIGAIVLTGSDKAFAVLYRQGEGDGSMPDRAHDGCRRGGAGRARQPHRPCR